MITSDDMGEISPTLSCHPEQSEGSQDLQKARFFVPRSAGLRMTFSLFLDFFNNLSILKNQKAFPLFLR
jgi:hypothetical protein